MAEGKDAPTVLLADACEMANNAEIIVNSDFKWDAEVLALIDTTVKNYIGDTGNPSIDTVYDKLKTDIKALLK